MTIDTSIVVAVVSSAALVIGTTITALVTRRSHRDTDVRADLTRVQQRLDEVERRLRLTDDYARLLRGDCEAAGIPVRPWPDALTTT